MHRSLSAQIVKQLSMDDHKIIIIEGGRRVGKTALVKKLLKGFKGKKLQINRDKIESRDILSSTSLQKLTTLVSGYALLFIDEAQSIEHIETCLKVLHDNFPKLNVIVSSSLKLDLENKISGPTPEWACLYQLYTLSLFELAQAQSELELGRQCEERMIFGSYPDVFRLINHKKKETWLNSLLMDNLYNDMLFLKNIKHGRKIRDLLRLLAFQVGEEISLGRLGKRLGLSKQTVAHYINLLEKSFVIFRLNGFHRSLKKELSKKPRIYFCDLGVRNALIDNFSPLDKRNDEALLWKNFLLIERQKTNAYQQRVISTYFWKTYTGAGLDYVEEENEDLCGYNLKRKKKAKPPKTWTKTYHANYQCVSRDNYLEFILRTQD